MPSTFDEVLVTHVGEFGKYQILRVLLASTVNIFMRMTSMSPVFIADNPSHYCQPPAPLLNLNCSEQQIRAYAVPIVIAKDGKEDNDKCHLFERNYTTTVEGDVCPPNYNFTSIKYYGNRRAKSNEQKAKCDTWHYDTSVYQSTVVTQWNLVCDRAWLAKNTVGLYMAARIVGTFVFGWLADR